jgi:hypothetical protein
VRPKEEEEAERIKIDCWPNVTKLVKVTRAGECQETAKERDAITYAIRTIAESAASGTVNHVLIERAELI